MKKFLILIFILLPLLTHAINYYPKASVDLSLTTSWGTATNGTGTNPSSFTLPTNTFIINKNGSVSNTWLVTNLTINTNTGTLTLNSPTTINGILTLTKGTIASNGNLTIDLNTGSIAGTGTGSITGNITLTKNILSKGWHYISTPLSGVTIAQFADNTTVNSSTCYYYDETILNSNNQVGWIPYATLTNPVVIGKGYILYYYNAGVIDFTGTYTHGSNYTTSVTNTFSNLLGYFVADGWNLISNPYPSTINWDNVNLSNVGGAVYCWDGANKRYTSYIQTSGTSTNGGTKYISSLQSFFVRANLFGSPKSVSFSSTSIVPNTSPLWRIANSPELLKIKITGKTTPSDETVVSISNNTSDTFESKWDAIKMFNGAKCPSIYTSTDINYAINSVSDTFDNSYRKELPLSMFCSISDSFTLEFNNTISNDYTILIRDNKTNITKSLDTYKYYYNTHDDSTRFTLIITKNIVTSTNPQITSNSLSLEVTSNNGIIQVNNPNNYTVYIYNLSGQKYIESTDKIINTRVNTGIYLVKGISKKDSYSTKIFVK